MWLWWSVTICGFAQVIGVMGGFYQHQDIKFLLPYLLYGTINIVVGWIGLAGR